MKSGRSIPKSFFALLVGWIVGTLASAAWADEPTPWNPRQFEQCQEILIREFTQLAPSPRDAGTAYYHCRRAREAGIRHLTYTGCVTDFIHTLGMNKYAAAHYCVDSRAGNGFEMRALIRQVQQAYRVDSLNATALVVRDWSRVDLVSSCVLRMTHVLLEQTRWISRAEAEELRPDLLNWCEQVTTSQQLDGATTCARGMDQATHEAFGTETLVQHCLHHGNRGYEFAYCFTYAAPRGCTPAQANDRALQYLENYCANYQMGDSAPTCPDLAASSTSRALSR